MEDEELERWIIEEFGKGASSHEVIQELRDKGYSDERISQLISEVESDIEQQEDQKAVRNTDSRQDSRVTTQKTTGETSRSSNQQPVGETYGSQANKQEVTESQDKVSMKGQGNNSDLSRSDIIVGAGSGIFLVSLVLDWIGMDLGGFGALFGGSGTVALSGIEVLNEELFFILAPITAIVLLATAIPQIRNSIPTLQDKKEKLYLGLSGLLLALTLILMIKTLFQGDMGIGDITTIAQNGYYLGLAGSIISLVGALT